VSTIPIDASRTYKGNKEPSEFLEAALRYARNGWAVLPLNGKIPRTAHGVKDATTDPEVIQSWWGRWPNANIGLATGFHFFVLDVDIRSRGDESIEGTRA
jgi:hypothetical protein